jgi:putative flavoprotein involved in K+ transport
MPTVETIVIGAGQAGLAMSRCLTDADREHVVFERGQVAERWTSERWDSLRLLTPNWMTRLPGWSYDGPDPAGYMTAAELARRFQAYARSFSAPVEHATTVSALTAASDGGYRVSTDRGTWTAANVVIATGWCDRPHVPAFASGLDAAIHQTTPSAYRNPAQLPDGGVLVVGASATGVQLADELRRAGRDVVLAVGDHTRLPRRYRGMDIYWWLDRLGVLDKTIDAMGDRARAMSEPSLQLIGRPTNESVDLATLQAAGIRLAGRVVNASGTAVRFADDLAATTAAADARLRRVVAAIDHYVDSRGLAAEVLAPVALSPVHPAPGPERLDLRAAGITSVLWATGFRRSYPWLRLPALDRHGELRHDRGVTPLPGLYVLGQRFQHRRNSHMIDGVGRDAVYIAEHLSARLATRAA